MFPTNSINFNPLNGRAIHHYITNLGLTTNFEFMIDATSGPCTFSISEPDGNQLLIDQH
jgi:hypothetical protein